MAKFGFNEWNQFEEKGGASFFSIKPGEAKEVRFVYNTLDEIVMYSVHEFRNPTTNAVTTISCAKPNSASPDTMCKWCSGGNQAVARVILPIYDVAAQKIVYWQRTRKFVQDNLVVYFQELVNSGATIASQKYKIFRTGEGLKTNYNVMPIGQPDGTTKESLGQLSNPYEMGMIKEADYDFDPTQFVTQQSAQNNQQYGQNNYNQQPAQQATRRTADTF